MSMPQSLQNQSTILVEYYFKEVCGLMSCYDSQMNPYRTTVANVWATSPALYYTTQSMAAACLAGVAPALNRKGAILREQALQSLRTVESHDTASLMALVMLGFSLSWHDPKQLGEAQFELLASQVGNNQFFRHSLVYWQMLLAFVSDKQYDLQEVEGGAPHPQTGLGTEVEQLVAEVGYLVRRERRRIRRQSGASRRENKLAEEAITQAEDLERRLLSLEMPMDPADVGDEMTPVTHLLNVAEAYRCTGLLQLYRNFPDLGATDGWMTCLALHIVTLVNSIPLSSRSRSIQPFLLVSVCSELSLDRVLDGQGKFHLQGGDVADVLHARRSVLGRLAAFENVLAAVPMRVMQRLVKEVWEEMDEHGQELYWMDLMMERGYETLMG
jgi:hypothetical protein